MMMMMMLLMLSPEKSFFYYQTGASCDYIEMKQTSKDAEQIDEVRIDGKRALWFAVRILKA